MRTRSVKSFFDRSSVSKPASGSGITASLLERIESEVGREYGVPLLAGHVGEPGQEIRSPTEPDHARRRRRERLRDELAREVLGRHRIILRSVGALLDAGVRP